MSGVLTNFFDEGFWLPDQVTWSSLRSTPHVRYCESSDLYVCLVIAPVIFILRSLFLTYVATNIGRRLGLNDRHVHVDGDGGGDGDNNNNDQQRMPMPIHVSTVLREALKTSRDPSAAQIGEIVKRTDLSEAYVQEWFQKQRDLLKPSKLERFSDCCLNFTWYASIFCYGVYALHDKCWFTDTKHYWIDYPNHPLSDEIYVYYLVSISFYLCEFVVVACKSVKRNDDIQMTIHHLVTLSLLLFSWLANQCRIGSVVLVAHDNADIWLHLGKMARYVNSHKLCDAAFALFAISWFVTRLVIFPLYPIYSAAFETLPYVDYFKAERINIWHACMGLLLTLLVMNVLWFGRIIQAIFDKIRCGEVIDNRSDEDD